MSEAKNNTVSRTIQILECLFDNDFEGKTEMEVSKQTGIPLTTTFRVLQTLKSHDWVHEVPVTGSKLKTWKVSTALVGISESYTLHALKKVQQIKANHLVVTGKELIA